MKITLKDGTEITLTVEGLLTLRDAETMAYLSYEANKLREQASLDNFKFNALSIRNAKLVDKNIDLTSRLHSNSSDELLLLTNRCNLELKVKLAGLEGEITSIKNACDSSILLANSFTKLRDIKITELEKQVKELKKDRDILNAFLKTTGKEGVDLCEENIKLRNENIELHCNLSQLELFSGIDKASGTGENVTFQRVPVYEMTRHANGNTREQFMAQTWTDELLVEFGYMKIKYQYVRSN
jgi:hypothetical protein